MTDSQAAASKRNIAKLQKAIVDGLENVKAQDLQVFDTEHITSLFERVILASGTSNRQTKALAASVRDAVREAGFDKPRTEGEDNGEWIIVDCGAAVVHIMQPSIRQYYHLEELWGDKPVRLKPATAPKARSGAARASDGQAAVAKAGSPAGTRKTAVKKTPLKTPVKAPVKAAGSVPAGKTAAPAGKTGKKPAAPAGAKTVSSKTVKKAATPSAPAKKTARKPHKAA